MVVHNGDVVCSSLYLEMIQSGENDYILNTKPHLPTDVDLDTRLACYTPYIFQDGLFARQFPVKGEAVKKRINANKLDDDIAEVSANFSDGKMWNSGLMTNGYYYTIETEPKGDEEPIPMKEIVVSPDQVPEEYYN